MICPCFSKRLVSILGITLFSLFLVFFHNQDHLATRNLRRPVPRTGLAKDIYNRTLGFEKIFVVGLPVRTDRRDGMVLQAAVSDINIDFIDGVDGKDIPDKAIPQTTEHDRLKDASVGSWRAHMNAVREIVYLNLSSALILEDDVDWDVRLREQLTDFALSANVLLQTNTDPPKDLPYSTFDISFHNLPATRPPTTSPYGDGWDVLWLGHCGMQFPLDKSLRIPPSRIIRQNDETVAAKKYLWSFANPFTLRDKYPEHARAVHYVQEGICTLGYTLSQRGARKLLYEVGLKDVTDAYDILLRFYCEGRKGRKKATCLTTQPSLIQHHRPAGPRSALSDIGNHGNDFVEKSSSDMVRWSVRLNTDRILAGDTNYWDQFPDP